MANEQVGSVSVRVLPDTKGFRNKLKAELEKIERQVHANLEVGLELAKGAAQKVKSQIEAITDDAKVTIDLDVDSAAAVARIKELQRRLNEQLVELEVHANTAAARAAADKLAHDISEHEPEMQVGLDTALAAARIAVLSRDRFITLHARLSSESVAEVTSALVALSGSRMLGDFGRGLRRMVTGLDQALPKVALLSTAITNLVSLAGTGIGNLLTIGSGLASIFSSALVLPALLAGMGVSFGVLFAALKDGKEILGDLGPQFSALQDSISASYWRVAEGAVRDFVSALMPLANRHFPRIAAELGHFTRGLSDAFTSDRGVAALEALFSNLRESIDIAGEGISYFTSGILELVRGGAAYLPRLASWFTEISDSFNQWASDAVDSGKFFDWVDDAIVNLRAFGDVIWHAAGFLSGLSRAASAAGSGGLVELANGLRRAHEAVDGPLWQGALTTVFEGMRQGVEALTPGVGALSDAFLILAPTLRRIMILAGEAGTALLEGFADVITDNDFVTGAINLFAGIRDGLRSLRDVAPQVGSALGAVMDVMGDLAREIGNVLAVAIEELAPAFISIMDAVEPLIPVLSGALIWALEALGPIIRDVAEAVSEFAQENPELAAGLIIAAAAAGLLLKVLSPLVGILGPVVSGIKGISTALGGLKGASAAGGALGGVSRALGGILRLAQRFAGPIALVVSALAAMWTNSENLRDSVGRLFGSLGNLAGIIGEKLGPVLESAGGTFETLMGIVGSFAGFLGDTLAVIIGIITTLVDVVALALDGDWAGAWNRAREGLHEWIEGVKDALGSFGTFLGDLFVGIMDIALSNWGTSWDEMVQKTRDAWAPIIAAIQMAWPMVESIISTGLSAVKTLWDTTWTALSTAVTTAWLTVTTAIQAGMLWLQTLITTGLTMLGQIWTMFWTALVTTVMTVWQTLVTAVQAGMLWLQTLIWVGLGVIQAAWTLVWNTLLAVVLAVFEPIIMAVQTGILLVQTIITTALAVIGALWSAAWALVVSVASTTWATIVAVVTGAIAAVQAVVSGVLSAIAGIWSSIWSSIAAVASGIWSSIVAIVSGAISSVMAIVSGVLSAIAGIWSSIWSSIAAVASGIWSSIVATVSAAMASLVGAIRSGAAAAWNAIQQMGQNIISTVAGLAGQMVAAGANMIRGFISGIKSMAGAAVAAAKGVVGDAVAGAKALLKIHSPSRVFMEIGEYTGEGFVIGLEHEAAAVQSAMNNMVQPPAAVAPQAQAADLGEGPSSESTDPVLAVLQKILQAILEGKELDGAQLIKGLQSAKRSMRMTNPI